MSIYQDSRISTISERDSDNRILECAIAGKVDYIISGDKRHILRLRKYEDIEILSPDEFLQLWKSRHKLK